MSILIGRERIVDFANVAPSSVGSQIGVVCWRSKADRACSPLEQIAERICLWKQEVSMIESTCSRGLEGLDSYVNGGRLDLPLKQSR